MSYFPHYGHTKNKIEVELDLSNKDEKDDLANLKSEVDQLDINKLAEVDADKLKSIPTDLSKLGNVVMMYMMLRSKILKITNLATNAALNAKINEIKNQVLSITNVATTTALTSVENKIPNVND